jgi:hypothetical protein
MTPLAMIQAAHLLGCEPASLQVQQNQGWQS